MKRIQNFLSFNESISPPEYPNVHLPKEVIKFLVALSTKRAFSQFIGAPWFSGLRLGDETPTGRPILLTWKDQTEALPFIYYTGNPADVIKDPNSYPYENKKIQGLKIEEGTIKELLDFEKKCSDLGWIDPGGFEFSRFLLNTSPGLEPNLRKYPHTVFTRLLENYRKNSEKFNIFDHDFMSLPEMKQLNDLGAKVVSTPIEKKNGTLSIEHPNVYRQILLQTTGYIRYKGVSGYITTNPELIKPLSKLEDIIPKLVYVKYMIIRNSLEKVGLSKREINQALKSFYYEDHENYSKLAQEIVQKYPSAVLYLPDPAEGFDQSLVKGAKLMGRLGLF